MKLKSFGCSFIYGSDLADEKIAPGNHPSALSWPALLAKQFNFDYECYARAGAGNLYILEQVLTQAADQTQDLFVIGWTWIDRFDYTNTQDEWKTILPVDTTADADFYYRNFHSQYKDKLMTLMYIRTAIDVLKQKSIPFMMTFMDDLILETKWHTTPAISDMQNYIQPWLTTFDGQTFLNWSKKNNFPISEKMHPLETAHAVGAKYMISEIQNYLNGRLMTRNTG
jgi:hypothetical protein